MAFGDLPLSPHVHASVIIPCRNASGTVSRTVEAARNQTHPPLEVIVVDDASTDDSARVAETAGARVLRSERQRNAGGARNAGIEAALGEVIAFLDADAIPSRNWLERVKLAFEADPEVIGVGGRILNGRPGRYGDLDYFMNHSEWMSKGRPSAKSNIPTMGVAYRRNAIGSIRFPESNSGEDTSFALAILAGGGKLWYDPEITLTHIHERLDAKAYREKQIACGRTIYWTRAVYDRPGRILVRFPPLLFLFPHLWLMMGRMIRSGYGLRAVMLFPWFVQGELARIRGFFEARSAGIPSWMQVSGTVQRR